MAEQKIAPEFSVFEMELDQPFFVLSETEPFTKITGELKFELTKPLPKTEKLVFRFLGGVVARHDETRNNSKLRGLRRLFDKELILWEPNVDHPEMDPTDEQDPRSPAIVGRTRTLCFSVKVPSTTPPTSSWKRGHIQYLLVASFFHEPACISCCGGIRIPLLGYRDPDVIKKEIIIRRASPGLLTSLPAYSELAPAKAEGEAEKPAEQNEEEERKVAERLFRKHRENVLRWRPLKDMEIVIPAVIHNNEEKVHVLVESGKSPKIINTSEEGVDSIGDEVELQCFSWCLKQIEKYELTHVMQAFDEPAQMERKVIVDRDNELTLPSEVSLEGVFPPIEDGVASVAFEFRALDDASELEAREVEPVDDVEASNVINVSHVASLVLRYKVLSTSEELSVSIDAPVLLHTPFDAAQFQRDIEKIQADRALREEFERARAASAAGGSTETVEPEGAVPEAVEGEVRQRTTYAADGVDE